MDSWEKFDETVFRDKDSLHSGLNIADLKILIINMQKNYGKTLNKKKSKWTSLFVC